MFFIHHFLAYTCFSIGFLSCFLMPIKNKHTYAILLLFMTGLGIGIYEHISYQDANFYSREDYIDLVVYLKPLNHMPWRAAVCSIIHNDYTRCPPKNDPRWQQSWFFGENI